MGGTYSNGNYHRGLVYDGEEFAVYVVEIDESNPMDQAFMSSKFDEMNSALSAIDPYKPVFVVSHFPIHHYGSGFYDRTTENAINMINVLNNYSNVVFLWGHNHTVHDSYYGQVVTAGNSLQYSSSSSATINFTYLSCGAMLDGNDNNGAYGLLATLTKSDTGTIIDFNYKNLNGNTASSGSVYIPAVSGPIPITSAKVTGIDMPVAESGSRHKRGGPIRRGIFCLTGDLEPRGQPFGENTAYTASVTLTANTGYVFAPGVTAKVNNADANAGAQHRRNADRRIYLPENRSLPEPLLMKR
jgi:hypothetical protein